MKRPHWPCANYSTTAMTLFQRFCTFAQNVSDDEYEALRRALDHGKVR